MNAFPSENIPTTLQNCSNKIFIGGLLHYFDENLLKKYFCQFGNLISVKVVRDKNGLSRCFGFLVFEDFRVAEYLINKKKLSIDGHQIEIKKPFPKNRSVVFYEENPDQSQKIFVGGIGEINEKKIFNYFSKYGQIRNIEILNIKNKKQHIPRGFCFVTFETKEAASSVLSKTHHEICKRKIECKKAVPKRYTKLSTLPNTPQITRYGNIFPSIMPLQCYTNFPHSIWFDPFNDLNSIIYQYP